MIDGQFVFSMTNSEVWPHVPFNTKEEALEEGNAEAKLYKCDKFFIGQAKKVELPTICATSLLEKLNESTYEEFGEIAEDYLWGIDGGEVSELEAELNRVFGEWATKHGLRPTFFTIENIEEIKAI